MTSDNLRDKAAAVLRESLREKTAAGLREILRPKAAGLHTRIDLKRFLHETCGLTASEAAAKTRELCSAPDEQQESSESVPTKNLELTRAGVARAFRDVRQKEAARLQFVQDHVRAQVQEATREMPVPPNDVTYCDGTVRSFKRTDTAEAREEWWAPEVRPRVAAEIVERLDACKDRDQLEAELVRLDWSEDAIAEYVEEYGPRK